MFTTVRISYDCLVLSEMYYLVDRDILIVKFPRIEILVLLWTCITRIRPRLVLFRSLRPTLLFAHPFCGESTPTFNP